MMPSHENLRHFLVNPPPLSVRDIWFFERLVFDTQHLTNTTHRGFHPVTECMLNLDVTETRILDHVQQYPHTTGYIDYVPFASFTRSDLTMRYVYDTADVFLLGDELVTLPFVTYVYRRDSELMNWEIAFAILEGRVPERYKDRRDDGPMSRWGFLKMIMRFGRRVKKDWWTLPEGEDMTEIYEKGSGLRLRDWRVREYRELREMME